MSEGPSGSEPPPEVPDPPDGLSRLDPDAVSRTPEASTAPEPTAPEPAAPDAPDAPDATAAPEPDAPERAGGDAGATADPDGASCVRNPPVVIDTRRYRWAIGVIGLVIVAAVSIYQFISHGPGDGPGVPVGHRLQWFAAPLAASTLRGAPNLNPPCTVARHERGALNLCLDAERSAIVISFFVPASTACVNQVSALQELAPRFPSVQFLAVAVDTSAAKTEALVRSHHWTIPVAYDEDDSVGGLYNVAVCPMAELATRGGIVRDRLVGDRWQSAAALQPRVRALAASAASSSGASSASSAS